MKQQKSIDATIDDLLDGKLLRDEKRGGGGGGGKGGGLKAAVGLAVMLGGGKGMGKALGLNLDPTSALGKLLPGGTGAIGATLGKAMGGGSSGAGSGGVARLNRMLKATPEVMVKVTFQHAGRKAVINHMSYISRNGQIELENEQGQGFADRRDLHDIADIWGMKKIEEKVNPEIKDTVNIVFSMPVDVDDAKVRDAVRSTLKAKFAQHRYVFALHSKNTDPGNQGSTHPHVHVVVQKTGIHGKRLRHGPEELMELRKHFASELRVRGIEAEATRRYARGLFAKSEKIEIRKIKDGGRVPDVAAKATKKGVDIERQKAARQAFDETQKKWKEVAERLKKSDDQLHKETGKLLEKNLTSGGIAVDIQKKADIQTITPSIKK